MEGLLHCLKRQDRDRGDASPKAASRPVAGGKGASKVGGYSCRCRGCPAPFPIAEGSPRRPVAAPSLTALLMLRVPVATRSIVI